MQEGVPHVIPAEMCYLGWQESLILLAKLVEAEIRVNITRLDEKIHPSIRAACLHGGGRCPEGGPAGSDRP